jgi:UrcA family protein
MKHFSSIGAIRRALPAIFAFGALAAVSAAAQADDPEQVDQITISAPNVTTVGRDSATGAPIEETVKKAKISVDPVTLTTNSGVALLKDAVYEAATNVCASIDPLDGDDDTCIRDAIKSAQAQVDAAVARARSTTNS